MSTPPFVFEKSLFQACATTAEEEGYCSQLFQEYSRHYYDYGLRSTKYNDRNQERDDAARYERFLETVRFIDQHNSNSNNNNSTFRLALNQFADHPPQRSEWKEEWNQPWEDMEEESTTTRRLLKTNEPDSLFTPLRTALSIQQQQQALLGFKLHAPKKKHRRIFGKDDTNDDDDDDDDDDTYPLVLPKHMAGGPFQTVTLPSNAEGLELDLKLPKKHRKDTFSKSLNWATTNNPDGVPLVHGVFDQGSCGSCWAFVATGTVETSVARHAAHEAYREALHQNARHPRRAARKIQKRVFQRANLSIQELVDCDTAADQGCTGGNPLLAFFYIHRYGLVPWDEYPYSAEQGVCPLDRNHPIATVQSWGILPKNHEDRMELALRYIGPVAIAFNGADPAFVSYQGGIFDKPQCDQGANHALLIVGYDEEIIIVENTTSTKVVRYWIVRNSWGVGWGEDGYVRIKRGPGGKNTPGVCGIAKSPSVALGGQIRLDRRPIVDHVRDPTVLENREYSYDDGRGITTTNHHHHGFYCDETLPNKRLLLQFDCPKVARLFDEHRAVALGIISIVGALMLVVWPLSLQCRRRWRKRRRRLSPNSMTLLSNGGSKSSSHASLGVLSSSFISTKCDMEAGETTPLFHTPTRKEQDYGSK